MSKFIAIEHSLRNIGGHHYTFACELLARAEGAGFQPVLGVHRGFDQLDRFPAGWRVFAEFPTVRNHSYHPVGWWFGESRRAVQVGGSALESLKRLPARSRAELRSRLRRWNSNRRRVAEIESFHSACRRMFEKLTIEEGDHVFLGTMEESSFLGLAAFLAETPEARRASWHLQFQYALFAGRDPDHERQASHARRLRAEFQRGAEALQGSSVYYYTTTTELARQFERLGIGTFDVLPWPVSKDLRVDGGKAHGLPLRLVAAGALRRDKGKDVILPLTAALRRDPFLSEAVQLFIQSSPRKIRKLLRGQSGSDGLVVALPHPMESEAYLELIRSAQIGLLLNDPEQYSARCSGPLIELLAAGTPILVPAGSWLSGQVDGVNQQHLRRVLEEATTVWNVERKDLRPDPGTEVTYTIEAPPYEGDLVVSFISDAARLPGRFVGISVVQLDSREAVIARSLQVLETHDAEPKATWKHGLFHLRADTRRVRFSLRAAYRSGDEPLRELRVRFLENQHPLGAVGLVYSGVQQLPELLRDLVQHYPHYAESARRLAEPWARKHSVKRMFDRLHERAARAPSC